MPPLPVLREEAFARALAMGLSLTEACIEAGYIGNWKQARKRAARPDIVARVTALRDERHWDGTADVAPVINALMRLARKAGDMPTAAAMAAARGLLAEAAKLKDRLEDKVGTPSEATPIAPQFLPLSDEDWAVKYGDRA